MLVLLLASARLCKLWILCLIDLFNGDLYKYSFYFHIFSFFWFSNMILSDALILPISQLQTEQVMTSQIRSDRIFNTYLLYSSDHFLVEIDEKSSLNSGFKCDLMMVCDSGLCFGAHPVCVLCWISKSVWFDAAISTSMWELRDVWRFHYCKSTIFNNFFPVLFVA